MTNSIVFQSPGLTDGVIEELELEEEIAASEEMISEEEIAASEEMISDYEGQEEDDDFHGEEDSRDISNRGLLAKERKASCRKQNARQAKLPLQSTTGVQANNEAKDLCVSLDRTTNENDDYDFNTDFV